MSERGRDLVQRQRAIPHGHLVDLPVEALRAVGVVDCRLRRGVVVVDRSAIPSLAADPDLPIGLIGRIGVGGDVLRLRLEAVRLAAQHGGHGVRQIVPLGVLAGVVHDERDVVPLVRDQRQVAEVV